MKMKPPLVGPPPPVNAMALATAWVGLDDIDDVLRSDLHRLEGNVLRALDAAEGDAVILLGKESFGDDPKEVEVAARW